MCFRCSVLSSTLLSVDVFVHSANAVPRRLSAMTLNRILPRPSTSSPEPNSKPNASAMNVVLYKTDTCPSTPTHRCNSPPFEVYQLPPISSPKPGHANPPISPTEASPISGISRLLQQLLCLVHLGRQVRTAPAIGVVQQHQRAVRLADLVLGDGPFAERQNQGRLALRHARLEPALVKGLAERADAAARASEGDEARSAL